MRFDHGNFGSFAIASFGHRWAKLVHSNGHVWIPVDVPLNTGGDQLVAAVMANVEEVATIAYAPLD